MARFEISAPLVLEGRHARLEPLQMRHAEGLLQAGRDASVWTYMPCAPLRTLDDAQRLIEQALASAAGACEYPFVIIARPDGRPAGSTRYLDIRPAHRGLEIGWTWLGADYQRTAINTECKYLLLRHAFEELGAIRVHLKTDLRNVRSQKAIERIGGVREGVLRRCWIMWDGHVRDSVYYSILDGEWGSVKKRLETMLDRAAGG